jgi:hypothetical protein
MHAITKHAHVAQSLCVHHDFALEPIVSWLMVLNWPTDECSVLTPTNNCDKDAECSNMVGSFSCESFCFCVRAMHVVHVEYKQKALHKQNALRCTMH